MEIIHVVLGKANPARMNGVNKVVYQLATNQADSGRRVSVWGITKDTAHNYGERNFETRLFIAHANPFKLNKILKEAILLKSRQAVFHLHGGWIPVFFSLASFLKSNKIPYVITGHGAYNTVAMEKSKWIKKLYFHLFEKHLLRGAEKVHSIGESEVKGLQQIFKKDNNFLMPYGFEVSKSAIKVNKTNEFIIGFVGRLTAYTKGLDLLLTAFKQFHNKYPESKLWLVGDGDDRDSLVKLSKELNLDNVIFHGAKYGEEKDTLIKQMNVFAHPSRNEGLPSSVLEAASLAVPSVVSEYTNVGNFLEEFEAGIKIKENDAHHLALAFEQLYLKNQTGNLEKLGLNARKMVEQAFSWKRITQQFDALYTV